MSPATTPATPVTRRGGVGGLLLLLAALGAAAVAWWGVRLPDVSGWLFASDARRSAPVIVAPPTETVPLPSASELYVARSRALFKTGRLRDALRELDRVSLGDSNRAAADRLRAEIQVELLAAAVADPGSYAPQPRPGDSRPMNEVP